jgi:Transcriptional regulator/sugar kinase
MLEVNESLVFDAVRAKGATTRLAIADELGLSPATVARAVTRLLRHGLISEEGGKSPGSGRPRGIITFNENAGAVIAVNLGAQWCRGVVTDLAGNIRGEHSLPTTQAGTAYGSLLSAIRTLQDVAASNGLGDCVLAVSVPAILDLDTGEAIAGPNLDWDHFDLVSRLRSDIGLPVTVENEAKLTALAHAWRGMGQGVADFAVLSIGTGVGGAVVANGQLLKGAHNAAGEIGYLLIDQAQVGRPMVGRLGGLESVLAGPSIARRASDLMADDGRTPTSVGEVTARSVFEAARAGDPVAKRVVAEVLDHVAMAIIGFAAAVDPQRVILDGAIGRALEPYTVDIAARVEPRLPRAPEIVVSDLQPNARLVGAIAAGLELSRQSAAPSATFGTFRVSTR